jgi:glutathione S-transferase
MALTLYTCEGARGLRCTWTAAELGLELPLVMLPFPPRALARDYLTVNPLGTVPALVDDDGADAGSGVMMTESCAIALYLAQRFGGDTLALRPDEPDYPLFLDFLHHADATLTFPQTVSMRFCLFEPERGLAEAGAAYGEWFGKRLAKVDARLQSRDFLCGDRFTVADICIAYALWLTRVSRLQAHLTPRLVEWLAQVTARPSFIRAQAWEHEEAVRQGVARG